jgi:hypothetical protein
MSKSLHFLVNSIRHLGVTRGFRYWKIYRTCKKDPWLIRRWEQVCRWESAKLAESDPAYSQMLEDWADALNRKHISKNIKQNAQ